MQPYLPNLKVLNLTPINITFSAHLECGHSINLLQYVKRRNKEKKENSKVKVFSKVIFNRLSLSGLFDNYGQFSWPTEQHNHSLAESPSPARENIKEYLQSQ